MSAKEKIQKSIKEALRKFKQENNVPEDVIIHFNVERPKVKEHGDFATNVALELAKVLKTNPLTVANSFMKYIGSENLIKKAEVAKPGFINFFLANSYLTDLVLEIEKQDKNYGTSQTGEGKKLQIEFVGANPTGSLNVVNGRAGALGDTIAALFSAIGFSVEREYFINDMGHQIELLVQSVEARYKQALGEKAELPSDGYHGKEIAEIGEQISKEYEKQLINDPLIYKKIKEYTISFIVKRQKETLEKFGVKFDNWFHESSLHEKGKVVGAINKLKEKGRLYEKENAVWLKTTSFGDDKDRVIVRSDGTPTYLPSDIAYYLNKLERGFNELICILGPDHHGHAIQMKAAISSLGLPLEQCKLLIIQQVNIMEGKEKLKMSKRAGNVFPLSELVEEVGKDVVRYFFLMRSAEAHLDFDLELARKHTDENPVFYIQYAHARICSILKYAKEQGINLEDGNNSMVFNAPEELDILKKLEFYPELIESTAFSYTPHWITDYLETLAGSFHKFYAMHRVVSDDKKLTYSRLRLINGVRIVIRNALSLLGISSPEKM